MNVCQFFSDNIVLIFAGFVGLVMVAQMVIGHIVDKDVFKDTNHG